MDTVLDVYEIAGIIHCSPTYVCDLVKSGFLTALNTGKITVSLAELVRFLTENVGMDLNDPFHPKKLFNNLQKGSI